MVPVDEEEGGPADLVGRQCGEFDAAKGSQSRGAHCCSVESERVVASATERQILSP